jgi:mannose-6-phosphate isomerase
MTETLLYPFLFEPVYMQYIWGGNDIARHYKRAVPRGKVAESWEIADRPEGMSVVSNGALAGKTLRELVEKFGKQLTGSSFRSVEFPLLIKVIDAKKRLSVQVHPDANTAAKYGGEPKTEAWYVLKAERGAHIYAGLKPDTDRRRFENAIHNESLEKVLRAFPARAGSVFYVPGGRVHAIGEGCMLLEIQQNSNTTYRVYDWGRVDEHGNARELHIDKALKVIKWDDNTTALLDAPQNKHAVKADSLTNLISSPYFNLGRQIVSRTCDVYNNGKSFHILFVEHGELEIVAGETSTLIRAGTSCLIPAAISGYKLSAPGKSKASVLTISIA